MKKEHIEQQIIDHFKLNEKIISFSDKIEQIAEKAVSVLKKEGTIFWCGNGGSASDSQHLAAELVGRFEKDRPPLKSIALNTDTSIMTAISNDYSYDLVFKRQLEVLGNKKDLLIAISTSGNSKNIIKVLEEAKKKKLYSVALLGKNGGEAKNIADLSIIIPSQSTARIQEMHILIGHLICSFVEKNIFREFK